MSKLNLRQKKFCDEYIKTGNIYQSAIKVGYSENYAKGRILQMLENVSIKEYIEGQMKKLSNNNIATAEEVLTLLTNIARGIEVNKFTKYIEGEPIEVEEKPDFKDRLKAAELIGKRYAIFTDKQQVDVTVSKPLEDWLDEYD